MSDSFTITGTVRHLFDAQTFASGFFKRELVVESGDRYPQMLKFELHKERTQQLDRVREGDLVNVHFNIRGNEHAGRFYVSLVAWKVEAATGSAPASSAYARPQGPAPTVPPRLVAASARPQDDDEDVPF
jgi:hypothetical protein